MVVKLVISYILIVSGVFFFLNNEKNIRVERYLQNYTSEYITLYQSHYDQFKEKSNIIFDILVNTPEVITIYKQLQNSTLEKKAALRKELYTLLETRYKDLGYTKLKQLHFHLSNNESFLRFHKPDTFGDNLSDIRETIAYVNKYKKPIDGFEEGRIYGGYRFVFPLSDEQNNHLGSVEISFNISIFTAEFMMHFNVLSNFHIKAEVIEKKVWVKSIEEFHTKSPIDGYYMEKNILQEIAKHTDKTWVQRMPNTKNLLKMKEIVALNKPSTLYIEELEEVLTIIPVQNSVSGEFVAFLTVRGDGSTIKDVIHHFYRIFSMVSLFLFVIFFLLYKKLKNQEDLQAVLEHRVNVEVENNRMKDAEMLKHAKMSSLGEMIGNIAHQWRQPLSTISASVSSINVKRELGTLKEEDIDACTEDIIVQTQQLSDTIDIFRNFVQSDKKKQKRSLLKEIDESLEIVSAALGAYFIRVKKDTESFEDSTVSLVKGELSQVLINLFANAKDALKEKDIEDKWIEIALYQKKNYAVITVEDNGGGIDEAILDRVFEPYFTTKHKSHGTGLGLHMSYKIITQSFHGNIYVKNTQNGAKFFIEIPLA